MRFITPAQCRAARALLNWTQPKLAKKCGMHIQTISSFEHETNTPTKKTLEKIYRAFEISGIEFTDGDGVKNRNLKTLSYRGHKGFLDFMNLVYLTAKKDGGDICTSNIDEHVFEKRLGKIADKVHNDKMVSIRKNYNFRILIKEGDRNTIASEYAEYRWLPTEYFHSVPFYTFGDYLAFLIFDKETLVHVIENKEIASAQRTQFNFVWDQAKEIPEE